MGYSKYESDLSISVGWEDIREEYKMLYMQSNGPRFLWKSQWHFPIVKSGCLIAPFCGRLVCLIFFLFFLDKTDVWSLFFFSICWNALMLCPLEIIVSPIWKSWEMAWRFMAVDGQVQGCRLWHCFGGMLWFLISFFKQSWCGYITIEYGIICFNHDGVFSENQMLSYASSSSCIL